LKELVQPRWCMVPRRGGGKAETFVGLRLDGVPPARGDAYDVARVQRDCAALDAVSELVR
jgi:hypothetical protein